MAIVVALSGCSWPMFGYDAAHTGFSPNEDTISIANVGGLHRVLRGAVNGGILASPVESGGSVYAVGGDGRLYAFPERSGLRCLAGPFPICGPSWTAGGGFSGSPAVANGYVFALEGGNEFVAFDAAGKTNCSGTPVVCTPVWDGGGDAPGGHSSPSIADGFVYSGYSYRVSGWNLSAVPNCAFQCFADWSGNTTDALKSSPAVADGVVYVSTLDGNVEAFDAHGVKNCTTQPMVHGVICQPLWVGPTGSTLTSSPAVANGVVYVGSSDHNLYAFDANGTGCTGAVPTCSPLWVGHTGDVIVSSPAVARGVVYIGSRDDKLYAFPATANASCTGQPKVCAPLWTATTGGDVDSSPAVANGLLFVGSNDGKLYAFDATGATGCSGTPKSCAPVFTYTTGGAVQSTPIIADGAVYFGSADSEIYGLAP